MSILAVGSVAFDNIATPSGKRENVLGGSVYALRPCLPASLPTYAWWGWWAKISNLNMKTCSGKRGIDTRGIEHVKRQDLPLGRSVSGKI